MTEKRFECGDCGVIHTEGECDEAAYHREECELICPNCLSNDLREKDSD